MKTTTDIVEKFIESSLALDYSGYTIPTPRGEIVLSDFTDTSAKVAFEKLTVGDKLYSGIVTLVRNEGVWGVATGISDRKIMELSPELIPLLPADSDAINSIHDTLFLAVQFWYTAQPATVKMRELQLTIQQKNNARELAISAIAKLQKIVKENPEDIKVIDEGISIAKENRDRIKFVEDKSATERNLRTDLRVLVSNLLDRSSRE